MSSDRAVGGSVQNVHITILFLYDFYKGYFAMDWLKMYFFVFSKNLSRCLCQSLKIFMSKFILIFV